MLEMNNKILTGNKFHFYLNPERDVPPDAYRIHGISTEFLRDKPLFATLADEFMDFIEGGRLVIHNASFDMKFINHELSLVNKPSIDMTSVTDTLSMARRMFPGARANLDALCKKFKIDNSSRKFHGALLDAELLSEVYVELTGGRQVSFAIKTKEVKALYNNQAGDKAVGDLDTLVMQPSTDELAAHARFLEKIPGSSWS